MLEGNSKGSALRKLTHRPTSRGQCTCWECSKDIFKANEKLNEVVFDSLRREKLANGERMIDYPSFLEITAGRLTQDHWQAVQMQVFMQLDEMCDKESSEKKPNFKQRISKKASNTTKIINGCKKVTATIPAVDAISSLPYEPDGVETLNHPLEKSTEKKIIRILNESFRDLRLPTQGELDELAQLMMASPTMPQTRSIHTTASSSSFEMRRKKRTNSDNNDSHQSALTTGAHSNGRRCSSRTTRLPKVTYAESSDSGEDFASEISEEYEESGFEKDDNNYCCEEDENDEEENEGKEEPSSRKRNALRTSSARLSTDKIRKKTGLTDEIVSAHGCILALSCI